MHRTSAILGRAALLAAACGQGLGGGSTAAAEAPGPPEWFREHIEFMTEDGGRWITDNSAYRSEGEPFDEYGMVWEKGLGGASLKGRLFGLVESREVATFWEFRTVWNPSENRVVAFQWGGDGTYASGTMIGTGPRTHRTEQLFVRPDGSSFATGHEATEEAGGRYQTLSFDILPDGSWQQRRSYLWKRTPRAEAAEEPGAAAARKGVEPMSQADHDRRVDYIEFPTTDMEATKRFYSEAFGWEFTDYGPDYTSFADGRLTGGFRAEDQVAAGGPLVVLYAVDLEAMEARVRASGGRIVRETFEFPGGRRFHFADPAGNKLAVWSDR